MRTSLIIALLAIVANGHAQQTQVNNQDMGNLTVRRIVFDREDIKVVLSDGTSVNNVTQMKASIDKAAGIEAPKAEVGAKSWGDKTAYDLQGRRLAPADARKARQGVYVVRQGKRSVKQIKR